LLIVEKSGSPEGMTVLDFPCPGHFLASRASNGENSRGKVPNVVVVSRAGKLTGACQRWADIVSLLVAPLPVQQFCSPPEPPTLAIRPCPAPRRPKWLGRLAAFLCAARLAANKPLANFRDPKAAHENSIDDDNDDLA
jgi:hypothetical protein